VGFMLTFVVLSSSAFVFLMYQQQQQGGGTTVINSTPSTVMVDTATTGVTAKPLVMNKNLNKIHFIGRWWKNESDGSMEHSWGVGTFIVRMKGSTKLIMSMKSPDFQADDPGAYYTCRVNGVDHQIHQIHNEDVEVASDLAPNMEHIIRCGRNNEASYGPTIIYGVKIEENGELLQAVDPNAHNTMLRFEAIGDSIAAGFKVTAKSAYEPATIANQDVFQSYVRSMADAWKTEDWNVIAKSGISILDYDGKTGVVMSKEWVCRQFWDTWQGSCPTLWDFSTWQADVVTINLGTNDEVFGDPTQQQFREGYLNFLHNVRTNYPNALIACIEPLLHSCKVTEKLDGIVNGMEQAVTDMDDPKVIYYKTGSHANQWLGCDTSDYVDSNTHPTVEGHTKFSARLLEEVTKDVRTFFPEKCGGSGSSCETGPPSPTMTPSPTPAPAPIASPTDGNSCVAIPQDQLPDGTFATTDSQCAPCSTGQAYWPCDTPDKTWGLCRCSDNN